MELFYLKLTRKSIKKNLNIKKLQFFTILMLYSQQNFLITFPYYRINC